jgi:hypothetical protein
VGTLISPSPSERYGVLFQEKTIKNVSLMLFWRIRD